MSSDDGNPPASEDVVDGVAALEQSVAALEFEEVVRDKRVDRLRKSFFKKFKGGLESRNLEIDDKLDEDEQSFLDRRVAELRRSYFNKFGGSLENRDRLQQTWLALAAAEGEAKVDALRPALRESHAHFMDVDVETAVEKSAKFFPYAYLLMGKVRICTLNLSRYKPSEELAFRLRNLLLYHGISILVIQEALQTSLEDPKANFQRQKVFSEFQQALEEEEPGSPFHFKYEDCSHIRKGKDGPVTLRMKMAVVYDAVVWSLRTPVIASRLGESGKLSRYCGLQFDSEFHQINVRLCMVHLKSGMPKVAQKHLELLAQEHNFIVGDFNLTGEEISQTLPHWHVLHKGKANSNLPSDRREKDNAVFRDRQDGNWLYPPGQKLSDVKVPPSDVPLPEGLDHAPIFFELALVMDEHYCPCGKLRDGHDVDMQCLAKGIPCQSCLELTETTEHATCGEIDCSKALCPGCLLDMPPCETCGKRVCDDCFSPIVDCSHDEKYCSVECAPDEFVTICDLHCGMRICPDCVQRCTCRTPFCSYCVDLRHCC